jgi:hypothetical protein
MAGRGPAIHEKEIADPRVKPGDAAGVGDDVDVVESDGEDGGAI